MALDTRDPPFSALVIIYADYNGQYFQGSGVLISPDEVLTASHVVNLTGYGVASSVQVAAGYDAGYMPFGFQDGKPIHYFNVGNPDNTISFSDSQHDYAVIHLATPVKGARTMSLGADYGGGAAHVTGYPGSANTSLVDSTTNVVPLTGYTDLTGQGLGPGSSGGPVWVYGSAGPTVVGVVSSGDSSTGTGYFAQLTSSAVERIQGWLQADDASDPLVDANYYLNANPDVAAAGVNATTHYEANGWHEGRNPNRDFSTVGYLAANTDVAAAGADPMLHYENNGWHEGRDPSATFDTRLYLEHNPDVAAAGVDPLQHYLMFGQYEGRATFAAVGPENSSLAGFDREYYLLANPDVARAGVDPLLHYVTNGWHEGRRPDAFFDPAYYLAQNRDVAAAGVDPLTHYDFNGWHEGRNASSGFNTDDYLRLNPDVAAAGVNPLVHYLSNGIFEQRAIS